MDNNLKFMEGLETLGRASSLAMTTAQSTHRRLEHRDREQARSRINRA
ncbi:hypothetical protein J3P89_09125 [Pseudomonas sp. Z1-14]